MDKDLIIHLISTDLPILLLVVIALYLLFWNRILRNRVDTKTHHLKAQVDENQRLYDALVEREKLKQDYFLSLSHELRTPLNVILSALQLQEDGTDSEDHQEREARNKRICALIKGNSYRLLRVINNLIDINKLDAGELIPRPTNLNLGTETRRIYEAVKPWFYKKAVRISFEEIDSSLITACDQENYERVVLNLLSNALKFTPSGGDVLITTVRNRISGNLVLSVKDTGMGIPQSEHENIFKKYLQLDRELVRNTEGNGLGLAIAKGFVELEGGNIQVISMPRKGTEFRVNYPAKPLAEMGTESGQVHRETLDYRVLMEFSEILHE